MPKIVANKILSFVVDKGPYAKPIKIDIESLYNLKETKDKEARLKREEAKEMKTPFIYSDKWVLFGEWVFELTPYEIALESDKLKLLLLETIDKERNKFERLKRKFSKEQEMELEHKRDTIPEEVRIAVWRRDGGKCVKCSSRENLEYDHIIPISKGGSNTARNIELLCEKCNREKRDNIQ